MNLPDTTEINMGGVAAGDVAAEGLAADENI